MTLTRISWTVTTFICVVAAVVVFLSGYQGYAIVLITVAAAAAINIP